MYMFKVHDNFASDVSFAKDIFLCVCLSQKLYFNKEKNIFVNAENRSLLLHSVGYYRQV